MSVPMTKLASDPANDRWGPPYLLYLGNAKDRLSIKTARGLAFWRPEWCVAQYVGPNCAEKLDLPVMDFKAAKAAGVDTMVLGVANAGGVMGDDIRADVIQALRAGLNVASGLHQRLSSDAQIETVARECGRELFDARFFPHSIPVGNGKPRAGLRMLTVGTDCSVGKMYTTLAMEREMRARGIKADFRATGQTGILIAGAGVPIDALVADFISGGAEWVSPARDDGGWDLIEGQGSLFHPSFAGVSLGLLHGSQPDVIVMCHEAGRQQMRGLPHYSLPSLQDCIEANLTAARLTNPKVAIAGVALNTSLMSVEAGIELCKNIERELGLPCEDPVTMGTARIVDRMLECVAK
jgi:uncharacterized NAD-dependent epimerase/dehydratase family protein